jgi:biofilm PGA synthesis N-glycosyltransferase PgaC
MIPCTIGIMAYNESANIGRLLDALLMQKTRSVEIKRIIVVSSGSTDQTDEIVSSYSKANPRIELIIEECRKGKASAINCFLPHVKDEIAVLQSADTLPTPTTIEALVAPFTDPQIGMVGGHPVPLNSSDTFLGFGVNLLWVLHHKICQCHPKMGELIAFRNIFRHIPNETAVDEASIEPLIVGQGLRLHYAPKAIVKNRGPETISDYIKQRRRIFTGHIYIKDTLGYKVSTMNSLRVFWIYLMNMNPFDWRYWIWGPGIILLESYCRFLGLFDYRVLKRNPFSWTMVNSTKDLTLSSSSVKLTNR